MRDAAEYTEASTTPDMAEACDSRADIIAEITAKHWPPSWPKQQMRITIKHLIEPILHDVIAAGAANDNDTRKLEGRELLARLIDEILLANNPRLTARCIDFVFQLNLQSGISQTSIAEAERVERATASKICVTLKETYLTRPAPGMKPERSIATFADAQRSKAKKPKSGDDWKYSKIMRRILEP
jgi:hypothetical protein